MAETFLRSIPLFSNLPDEALAQVEAALQERMLDAGQILFNHGDPGDELIIIKAGKISIYVPLDGAPANGQAIRYFTPGSVLGEMALLDEKPRSASARAEEASTILALSRKDFHQSLSANPQLSGTLMAGLSDRIRYTTDFLSEVRGWVQRITEGNYQPGIEANAHSSYQDPTLATLAAEFAQMAARVKEREDTLKQEVALLKIEIDETKRKQEASQIMDSDYYRELKEKIKSMRQQRDD
jgi:CRP-like cAMP-binding protein